MLGMIPWVVVRGFLEYLTDRQVVLLFLVWVDVCLSVLAGRPRELVAALLAGTNDERLDICYQLIPPIVIQQLVVHFDGTRTHRISLILSDLVEWFCVSFVECLWAIIQDVVRAKE